VLTLLFGLRMFRFIGGVSCLNSPISPLANFIIPKHNVLLESEILTI